MSEMAGDARSAYVVRSMTEEDAVAIAAWRYAPPYDVYNPDGDALELIRFFCDPANDYHAVYGDSHRQRAGGTELLGYCCYGADARVPGGVYPEEALDIGVGMRPDLTGGGRGHDFIGAIIAYGLTRYRPPLLRVTIAAFNERSQRVFRGHGFTPVRRFTRTTAAPQDFVIMLGEGEWTADAAD
jgi:RimJ/RimL family protein N-acetyltransferase